MSTQKETQTSTASETQAVQGGVFEEARAQLAGPIAAVPPKQISIGQFLAAQKKQIQAALPKHLNPDRLLRIAMTEIRKNPKLSICTQASLIGSILQAAQLGLEPGPQGHCFLIPFDRSVKTGNSWSKIPECQFMIGYKGMLDLVYRTGKVSSPSVHEVCANDYFKYGFGINEYCEHRPSSTDRGEIIGAYIVVRFKDGSHYFDYMTIDEINKVRDKSIAYSGWIAKGKPGAAPIWETNYAEMCKKTVIRRAFKYLPISIELQAAIVLDEAADRGEQDNSMVIEGELDYPEHEKISKSDRLEQDLSL